MVVHSSFRLRKGMLGLLAVMSMPAGIQAQAPADSFRVDLYIEHLLETIDTEAEIDESSLQQVLDLIEHPLDLNTCTREDLEQIPWLDPFLINALLAYRAAHGPYMAYAELYAVPSLTPALIAALRPLVRIGLPQTVVSSRVSAGNRNPSRVNIQLVQQYSRRLDLPVGYQKSADSASFEGSPASLYTRLALRVGTYFSARLVVDKDAGERMRWNPGSASFGFDHLAGAIQVRKLGAIEQLVAGDFGLNIGQGLLFWRPYGHQKGVFPARDPLKRHAGLLAAASREENAFFRGAAVRIRVLPVASLLLFHSRRSLDATLARLEAESGAAPAISSLSTTGLHRTASERARKDAQYEILTGGEIRLEASRYRFGLAAYRSQYRRAFVPAETPDRYFAFSGRALDGVSIHGGAQWGDAYLFTEYARSYPGNDAILAGLLFRPDPAFQFSMQGRRYSPAYLTYHGHAFGEQRSAPKNENGFYIGFELQFAPAWTFEGYMDQFEFPWLRYANYSLDRGYEGFIRLRFKPRDWLTAMVHYRNEQGVSSTRILTASNQELHAGLSFPRHTWRHQLDVDFTRRLSFRLRLEARFARSEREPEKGLGIAQDFVYRLADRLTLQARFALFDSDGRNATLYFYENDVQYRYSIVSFTGKGQRNFILLKGTIGSYLLVEIKYAVTRFDRVVSKGSGLDAYSGKQIRDLHLQFIWRI